MASAVGCFTCSTRHATTTSPLIVLKTSHPTPPTLSFRSVSHGSKFQSLKAKATENDQTGKKTQKTNSIVCADCEGNGALLCTQCKGTGVNSVDHFNGQFKAGGLCWLCRGKREILCGNCNGAGFLGGFMSTFDETAT